MHPYLKMLALSPAPARKLAGIAIRKLGLLPYRTRIELFMEKRAHYAYCLLRAAELAQRLNIPRISAIEFGVAGGNGLVNLEYHAARIERLTGVAIELYGFDSGEGLPAPIDYRDMPYHWQAGFFPMDRDKLHARLKRSKVLFGDVAQTVHRLVEEHNPAPIGCIFHDLDFYSSTKASFAIFNVADQYRLPRIFNYFDDIVGNEVTLQSEFTGELLAIAEYNKEQSEKKLAQPRYLRKFHKCTWHDQIYIHHHFTHPRYNDFVSEANQHLPL